MLQTFQGLQLLAAIQKHSAGMQVEHKMRVKAQLLVQYSQNRSKDRRKYMYIGTYIHTFTAAQVRQSEIVLSERERERVRESPAQIVVTGQSGFWFNKNHSLRL